jgi:UDP-N-acetylmuramyl tripeptide synthase
VARALGGAHGVAGRLERFRAAGWEVVLALVKNPAGAAQMLRTLGARGEPMRRLVVALNDREADGRDVSWIWDAPFELLAGWPLERVVASGRRAAEMAVRLKYAGLPEEVLEVEPRYDRALERLLEGGGGRAAVLATYTALWPLRLCLRRLDPGGAGAEEGQVWTRRWAV